MKLTVIGCTGSFPGPASPASCYLVSAFDGQRMWRILLDFGSGAMGVLQRYMELEDIDAILLSHLHPDHCMDLCGLHVAVRWKPGGWQGKYIPVYGPDETPTRMAEAYGMEEGDSMHSEFDFRTWKENQQVRIGPFNISVYPVRHPVPEAYAIRVEADEPDVSAEPIDGHQPRRRSVLTYSGDTDTCDELVEAARGANLFLCEAAFEEGRDDGIDGIHLTGKRAGQMAERAGAERLLLTHLQVWTDPLKTAQDASDAFSGLVAVAASGVSYQV